MDKNIPIPCLIKHWGTTAHQFEFIKEQGSGKIVMSKLPPTPTKADQE